METRKVLGILKHPKIYVLSETLLSFKQAFYIPSTQRFVFFCVLSNPAPFTVVVSQAKQMIIKQKWPFAPQIAKALLPAT